MGKLDRFKKHTTTTAVNTEATPIAMQSPLNRGANTTPKPAVSPLTRGTRNEAKLEEPLVTGSVEKDGNKIPLSKSIIINNTPKVPLVRGQSVSSGGSQITYNPKLVDRSKQMSREMTKAEQKIWFEVLSQKKLLGYKFIRQKVVFNYILDFYCSKLLLAIEIDGESHNQKLSYDKVREDFLKACGITVIRFTNDEVLSNLNGVRERLVRLVADGQG